MNTLELANKYLMPNYGKLGIKIVSGQGLHVKTIDAKGINRTCVDALSGLGVMNVGHCHELVVAAIKKQCEELMHVSNLYATNPMAMLAKELVELTAYPKAKVFFCNSGTEANEAAGKLARIYAHEKFDNTKTGKKRIIALHGSFHGRTAFSMAVTDQTKMQEKFISYDTGVTFVTLNDIEELQKAVGDDVCAMIFEIIQAEGGVNMMSADYYQEIIRLSKKHNFLTIVDEIQTGMGRTGEMFSYQYFAGSDGPDIFTLAKALGGGCL